MIEPSWIYWGVPLFGVAFAVVGLLWAYRSAREFDRKHGDREGRDRS